MLCGRNETTMERWAINIDLEGFSALWEKEDRVLLSLGELMRAIFRVGSRCFPQSPDRLFAYQLGDGFLVLSDFHEESLDRAINIAVALMRHVAATNRFAKASLAEGELSDIVSCYPGEVRDAIEEHLRVSMGMGLMTIFPVMGTALIRAVSVSKGSPTKGPLVILQSSKAPRLSSSIPVVRVPGCDLLSVDWVHMESPELERLQQTAGLDHPPTAALERTLRDYCQRYPVPQEWRDNVETLLRVPGTSSAA